MNFWFRFVLLYIAVDWILPKIPGLGDYFTYAPLVDTILSPKDPFIGSKVGYAVSGGQFVPVAIITYVVALYT